MTTTKIRADEVRVGDKIVVTVRGVQRYSGGTVALETDLDTIQDGDWPLTILKRKRRAK
jgi:hypothetical protein